MKELEKIFYGNVVAYDAAIGKHDDLQNVIWRYGIFHKIHSYSCFCMFSQKIHRGSA